MAIQTHPEKQIHLETETRMREIRRNGPKRGKTQKTNIPNRQNKENAKTNQPCRTNAVHHMGLKIDTRENYVENTLNRNAPRSTQTYT